MKKPDFSGWVTKNDIKCTDGVTIRHNAFKANDNSQVPIVWEHDYSSPSNVLGHMVLKHADQGVYGYGYFNDNELSQDAMVLLKHGDINAMSIGARGMKTASGDIVNGEIYEVSLVLKGANPEARIEHVLTHSDDGEEGQDKTIIHTGLTQDLLEGENLEDIKHADDATKEEAQPAKEENKTESESGSEKTVGDVLDSLTEEQQVAVSALIGQILKDNGIDVPDDEEDSEDDSEDDSEQQEVKQSYIIEGEEDLKHNIFEDAATSAPASDNTQLVEIVQSAAKSRASSLAGVLAGAGMVDIKHGVSNIDVLFPTPTLEGGLQTYNVPGAEQTDAILSKFSHSPRSRVKRMWANISEDEARARGYITGNQKLDSIYSVLYRETTPTTIVHHESLDREDVIDIEEGGVDIINFTKTVMQQKLKEEVVRAALIGDGRKKLLGDGSINPFKIDETNIRPAFSDDDLFTIKLQTNDLTTVVDDLAVAFPAYQGTGMPTLFINPFDLAKMRTIKDKDGHYLYSGSYDKNALPTNDAIAAYFQCSDVVPFMGLGRGKILVGNLRDYEFGNARGGEIVNFEDFDIDFNKYKYLAETRLSGAISVPKSFIAITVKNPETTPDVNKLLAFNKDQGTSLKDAQEGTVDTGSTEKKAAIKKYRDESLKKTKDAIEGKKAASPAPGH